MFWKMRFNFGRNSDFKTSDDSSKITSNHLDFQKIVIGSI